MQVALLEAAMPQTVAVITALILERPMCFACIAAKTGTSETGVEATLATIAPTMEIYRDHDHDGRCRACGNVGFVVLLHRRESAGP
jgi:hypothetical protein